MQNSNCRKGLSHTLGSMFGCRGVRKSLSLLVSTLFYVKSDDSAYSLTTHLHLSIRIQQTPNSKSLALKGFDSLAWYPQMLETADFFEVGRGLGFWRREGFRRYLKPCSQNQLPVQLQPKALCKIIFPYAC